MKISYSYLRTMSYSSVYTTTSPSPSPPVVNLLKAVVLRVENPKGATRLQGRHAADLVERQVHLLKGKVLREAQMQAFHRHHVSQCYG